MAKFISVLGSEVEHRHLRCVEFCILSLVTKKIDKVLLECCRFLLKSEVEILGVKVVKAVAELTELRRDLCTQCLLSQVIEDPDLLVINLSHALQASVLKWNIFKIRLVNLNWDWVAIIIDFRLERHLRDLQSNNGGHLVIYIFTFNQLCTS